MRRLRDKDKFEEYSEPLNGNARVRRLRGDFDGCALLRDWGSSKVTIFFDFGGDILWVLLPKTIEGRTFEGRYVFFIKRDLLIASLRAAR